MSYTLARDHCTASASSFMAEVITVGDSVDWSTSTPITAPSLAAAAAEMDWNMEPPQAKITSVPLWYQPLAMVCSSGEELKLEPYCQE